MQYNQRTCTIHDALQQPGLLDNEDTDKLVFPEPLQIFLSSKINLTKDFAPKSVEREKSFVLF